MILLDGLWSGLFATALGALLSAPPRALLPSFACGFVARVVRDSLIAWGLDQTTATLVASALAVFVAIGVARRPGIPPIVFLSGLIPLGTAGAFFTAIVDFLQIASRHGETLTGAPVALVLNLSKGFTTTLGIAVGAWLGMLIADGAARIFGLRARV
jgi:uncharacterized membrane protein YjjB (DUF3815 family)